MKTTLLSLLALFALTACGEGFDPTENPFAALQAVEADDPVGVGMVRVANEASLEELDDDVGLDARAAYHIVHHREIHGDFATLAEVDAVAYVGEGALAKLRSWALAEGYVPAADEPEGDDPFEGELGEQP
ncbi:MAG: helix-hairpin-helix domain-containing protein [Myxococcales bacterium]|nr:helix-hairpin-helix domain-containing protein [Myxococcales bacterium]